MFLLDITGKNNWTKYRREHTNHDIELPPKKALHSSQRNIKPPLYSIMISQLISLSGKRNQPQGSQHVVWKARRFVFCPDLLSMF
jgi:hypothetical protein